MSKYDFVYILKDTEKNEELKYSLRSIEANASNLINKIVFVGGKPKGFTGYLHVNNPQIFNTKHKNAIMGIYAACKTKDITDNFVLMNDDFYIMQQIEDITKYYDGSMKARIDALPDGSYKDQMKSYYDILVKEINVPLNYAVHTPMLINKRLAATMIEQCEPEHNFRNLYGNLTKHITAGVSFKDNKFRAQDKTWNKRAVFASSDDETFPKMKAALRAKFKNKSRWEI